MRCFSIIILAFLLVGCSRHSVQVSITNRSSFRVPMLYVCNGHTCQRVGALAPGATIQVTEPLAGEGLSLTYWIDGHEKEEPIPDAMIRSGLVSFTIETNYLVKP
jgi:hypothetical protein